MHDAQLQPRISGDARATEAVRSLYESRPYPPLGYLAPLVQPVRWEERQSLQYRAAYSAAFGTTAGAAGRPRILVAGCGTFESVVVALANPQAEIVAVDLSARSLRRLRWVARWRGLGGRILCLQADLRSLSASLGDFDFVIASGVVHHLPDPLEGLRALVARCRRKGVLRLMVYSRWGRSLLYAAKELARELGASAPRELRRLIESLPPDHPYRLYFFLYSDARSDDGLVDGYLHPCDRAFTARELAALLHDAGLEATGFLHGPEGQPERASSLAELPPSAGEWERLALLEAYGELEENFRFFACRLGERRRREAAGGLEWNEALPERGPLFSRILGRELVFDRRVPPSRIPSARLEELRKAFFLLPSGGEEP